MVKKERDRRDPTMLKDELAPTAGFAKKLERFSDQLRKTLKILMSICFIIIGLNTFLTTLLFLYVSITRPDILLFLITIHPLYLLGGSLYVVVLGFITYNAGIEHFPRLHRYRTPAPKALRTASSWVYKNIIIK